MNRMIWIGLAATALFGVRLAAQKPQAAETLLQTAIKKEVVDGDLKGAIEQYKKIVQSGNRSIAAQALLHMAACYQKLGNTEARKIYERIVREFGDQTQAVAAARAQLGSSTGPAAEAGALTTARMWNGHDEGMNWGPPSPDSSYVSLVDEKTGDLAVRDTQTGEVKLLTRADPRKGEHAYNPVPSRDGLQVAYDWQFDDYNPPELRIVNRDGSGSRVVFHDAKMEFRPADWSPDGKKLVGVLITLGSARQVQVAAMDVASGRAEGLRVGEDVRSIAGFSPDGKDVVASQITDSKSGNISLIAINLETKRSTPLTSGAGSNQWPVWAPGGRILFTSNRSGHTGIWSVRVENGKAAGEPQLLKADAGDIRLMGATNDGTLMYSLREASQDVYAVDMNPATLAASGPPRRAVDGHFGQTRLAFWSPDGSSFVYQSRRRSDDVSIFVFDILVRGTNGNEKSMPYQMPPGGPVFSTPFWCQDGTLMLLNRQENPGMMRRVNPETGANTVALDDSSWRPPGRGHQGAFSPDCRTLYISTWEDSKRPATFLKRDVATGQQRTLFEGGTMGYYPRVSPDEKWIAFGRQGRLEILSTEGGDPRPLGPAVSGVSEEFVRWPVWTADSKTVLYVNGDEVVAVSIDGGTPRPTGIRAPGISAISLNRQRTQLLYTQSQTTQELWTMRNLPQR